MSLYQIVDIIYGHSDSDFHELLTLATKESYFVDEYYQQIDGVGFTSRSDISQV